jgi:hypothetical protein
VSSDLRHVSHRGRDPSQRTLRSRQMVQATRRAVLLLLLMFILRDMM